MAAAYPGPTATRPTGLAQTVRVNSEHADGSIVDRPRLDQPKLQTVIMAELARRRSEVLEIDPRLADTVDLLVDFVASGGKRLRPEFLWCGWLAAGGRPENDAVLRVGAALELIQACALVHDDVIDRSERRRGQPATHRAMAMLHADDGLTGDPDHFGVSAAVLLGDLALAWADDLFLAGALDLGAADRALPVWSAMRTEVLSGQLLDLLATASAATDPAEQAATAMRVNRYKTAAYTVERPLHLGAVLAGGSATTVAALRSYGADIGVAFQLRDDLLGVFGDPAVTGKPAGDDLIEGKRTVLLAGARAVLAATPELLDELDAGVGTAGADTGRLSLLIADSGAPAQQEQQIAELVSSALSALRRFDADGRPADHTQRAGATRRTRPGRHRTGGLTVPIRTRDRSETGHLRSAVHLSAAVLPQGLDRTAGQRIVGGEQPVDDLLVVELGVPQQRDGGRQSLDHQVGADVVAADELGGNAQHTVDPDGEQLPVTDELVHLGDHEAQFGRDVGDRDIGWRCRHAPSLPPPARFESTGRRIEQRVNRRRRRPTAPT